MSRGKKILIMDLMLLAVVAAALYATGVYKRFILPEADPAEIAEAILSPSESITVGGTEAEKVFSSERNREKLSEWNLLLVNQWNAIPDDFSVETADIEDGYLVDARIKDDLAEMLKDCRAAGHSPKIISSFRTRQTQQYLYDHTANKADTALPGHSEHECGLAADIIDADSAGWSDPLIDRQEDMPAQKWLMRHCSDYGFILRYPRDKQDITGIIYEPWHYRYVGRDNAAEITERGICLEEYIEELKA